MRLSSQQPWAYLALPLALTLGFFYWPALQAVWMSLHDYQTSLYQPSFSGLANYHRLIHDASVWQSLWNTVQFVLILLPAMVMGGMGLAALVNRVHPAIGLIRTVLYLPVVVPLVVAAIAWKWLYNEDGLLNQALAWLHVSPVHWLLSPQVALWALALMIIWKASGYYMMIYLAQLQQASRDWYEAATLDGATPLQQFWWITLPYLKPTMAFVAIVCTIGCFKIFTEVYVMTQGGPLGRTETLVYTIYRQGFEWLDPGLASATGLLLMVILMGLTVVQHRLNTAAEKNA